MKKHTNYQLCHVVADVNVGMSFTHKPIKCSIALRLTTAIGSIESEASGHLGDEGAKKFDNLTVGQYGYAHPQATRTSDVREEVLHLVRSLLLHFLEHHVFEVDVDAHKVATHESSPVSSTTLAITVK